MNGLVGLLLRALGRTVFVLTRRNVLVLTHKCERLLHFGKQTHETRVFDRNGELALILGAGAGRGTRGDFSVGRDEPLKELHILIVDVFDVVLREVANFTTGMHLFESHVMILSVRC